MIRALLPSCAIWLCLCCASEAQQSNSARIGVLAYRGLNHVQEQWLSLRDYLDAAVPEWSFEIVPVTLASANTQIISDQLDFIVTNPGHFVELNQTHRMSVLASRSQKKSDGSYSGEFGSLIITRAGSGIDVLQDVAGRSVAAIGSDAFGGFQLAWHEFKGVGIDLFADTKDLTFVGFPMDQVVLHVAEGEADVGIVRSGLMEAMAADGFIELADFAFLNTSVTYSHPDMVSSRLYPEWPFAALATADPALKDKVTIALLSVQGSPLAARHGLVDTWSAPVPYHAAAELVRAFRSREDTNQRSAISLLAMALPLAALAILGAFFWRSRSRRTAQDIPPDHETTIEAANLTRREREILDLIAAGNSTKEIAKELGISPKTVEFHRSNLLKKVGARTSSHLVAMTT